MAIAFQTLCAHVQRLVCGIMTILGKLTLGHQLPDQNVHWSAHTNGADNYIHVFKNSCNDYTSSRFGSNTQYRKIPRIMQNFNMATIFHFSRWPSQAMRHYPKIVTLPFALKWNYVIQKKILIIRDTFEHGQGKISDIQTLLDLSFKSFQYYHHGLQAIVLIPKRNLMENTWYSTILLWRFLQSLANVPKSLSLYRASHPEKGNWTAAAIAKYNYC